MRHAISIRPHRLLAVLLSVLICAASACACGPGTTDNPARIGDNRQTDHPVDPGYTAALTDFAIRTAARWTESDTRVNRIYSPVGLWYSLVLCADAAAGGTREEILGAMGLEGRPADWIDAQTGESLLRMVYQNEEGRLAWEHSIQVDPQVELLPAFRDTIGRLLQADIRPLDDRGREAVITPVPGNSVTASGEQHPGSVAAVIDASLTFSDRWRIPFSESQTRSGLFRLADGSDVEVPFMIRTEQKGSWLAADGYTAAALDCVNGGSLVLVLPAEGTSPDSILSDAGRMRGILSGEGSLQGEVFYRVPRFDLAPDAAGVREMLRTLGVREAFTDQADLSAMSEASPLWIQDMTQSVRVSADEYGCSADVFTQTVMHAAGIPENRCELVLDRPFLFLLLDPDRLPLAVGVVGNPAG